MAKDNIIVLRGKLYWCKLLGDPVMNRFTEEREWSVDFTPDKEGIKAIKAAGAGKKLKEPKDDDEERNTPFISFRQREFYGEGENRKRSRPISVSNADGTAWDQNLKIGNGTVADVKFNIKDNGVGRPQGVYLQAVRILDHVPYEPKDFAPLSSDDEFFSKKPDAPAKKEMAPANADDLDDEIPF